MVEILPFEVFDLQKFIQYFFFELKKMTHGFPVPTVDRDEVVNESLAWLKEQNVWSRGRFGAFKYEVGNADHCFIQVYIEISLIMKRFIRETYGICR